MRRCLAMLFAFLIGCHPAASPTRTADFDAAFDRSIQAYTEYVLPNSMAQPEGTDLSGLQERRWRRFEEASKILHSAGGVAFLERRLSTEGDDLVVICGIHVLEESGQPNAREVIRKYAAGPNSTVAEHATAALGKLADAR